MQYLSVQFQSLGATVDRESRTLRGYVVAEAGPFRDERGSFNEESLRQITRHINSTQLGLKSRFGHPSFLSDGLGRFLGRSRNARIDTTINRDGKRVPAIRADLTFDPSAFKTPHGDLASYVLSLAESDPDAISSSLVIHPREEHQRNGGPPLWFPIALQASDIVEQGAAVGSLLDTESTLQNLTDLLDRAFSDKTDDYIEATLQTYLQHRLAATEQVPTPKLDKIRLRLAEIDLTTRRATE